MRHQTFTTFTLLLLLVAGCGGETTKRARPAVPPERTCAAGPGGTAGPGAVGISAVSTVFTGWAQGGPIAIHGTNEPWSIGKAVSNGCIRLPNARLRRVFAQALSGTPVLIRR